MTQVMMRLVVTPALADNEVPLRVWRHAQDGCWPTCEVCGWPIDRAALVAQERTPRHPCCVCAGCSAPLGRGDRLWHPQCRPINPIRRLRIVGRRS